MPRLSVSDRNELINLHLSGLSNRKIGRRLKCDEKTVQMTVKSIKIPAVFVMPPNLVVLELLLTGKTMLSRSVASETDLKWFPKSNNSVILSKNALFLQLRKH